MSLSIGLAITTLYGAKLFIADFEGNKTRQYAEEREHAAMVLSNLPIPYYYMIY